MNAVVRVEADGVRLVADVMGSGPALLFVHGFPLDRTMWQHQLTGIDGWTRIAPDLRGAGESAVPTGGYSMSRYADDLIQVLDAVGTQAAVCCGLSMGGYILFELLRRHPERVRALILCDTKSEPDTPEGKRGRDDLAGVARRDGIGAVASKLLPKLLGRSTAARDAAVVETVRAMVLRSPVEGVVGALEAMRDRPDSTPLLAQIAVPTLVLVGAEDELTPPAVVRPMAERIRGARFVEIEAAGHMAPLEQPGAVTPVLADFLGALG
ncbi:MAG TPA: alpha/beta fold hydrolase [Gemmatimonadales bacterium]|nr:alpha/beta fold hydrolase [Gemmatimonadales bacterium]